jgi:flavodoxin
MKTIIIYDSLYGNTHKVAETIGSVLSGKVSVLPISTVTVSDIIKVDLLIVGSPVHGGRPTPAVETFIKNLPANYLKGVKAAAFDTRFAIEDHGIGIRILISIIRYAAERIAKSLKTKGATLVAKPEGFIVDDKKGPLKKGELERVKKWAEGLEI